MDDDQHKGRPRSISGNPGFPGAGLIAWFVRNPVAANLLMLLFLLGGAFTAATMRTEVFPTPVSYTHLTLPTILRV